MSLKRFANDTDSKAGGPDDLMNFTQGKTTSERITVARLAGIGA